MTTASFSLISGADRRRISWPWPWKRSLDAAVALAASGLLIASAAMPDDRDEDVARAGLAGSPLVSDAAGGDRVFGAYLGAPYHYPSDFRLTKTGQHDLTIKDIAWYTHPFENPLYYGARWQSWDASNRFGWMIDFTHSKAYSPMQEDKTFEGTLDGQPVPPKAKVSDYFDKLEWTHGHNMLTLNGLMRFAAFGRFQPYAGAGAGISLPHSEIHLKADPSRTYEYQYTGPCAQALFGVELRLKTGSVFIEYKFTWADYWGPLTGRDGSWLPMDMWRQFSRWWSGEVPRDGWAGARLVSHQAVSGFLVRFKPVGVGRADPAP